MGITELAPLVGALCVVYTTAEFVRLSAKPRRDSAAQASFGAVDLQGGREIDVTIDRRVRQAKRAASLGERRSARGHAGFGSAVGSVRQTA